MILNCFYDIFLIFILELFNLVLNNSNRFGLYNTMKSYKVSLHRDYIVSIDANSEEEAKQLAEYFIAGEKDASTPKEQEQHRFRINEIEMVTNDAFEFEKLEK